MKLNSIPSTALLAALLSLSACGGGGNDVTAPASAYRPVLSQTPIVLASGASLGTPNWPDRSTATGGRGTPIAGVACLDNEKFHIRTHLAIFMNGVRLAIPKDVGLQGCTYEVHTHDQSGILHIETSTERPFTLGQFFAVWGEPLSNTNVAGLTGLPIMVFINDGNNLVEYKGDLAAIALTQHRSITIQIGLALAEIPSYQFPPGS